MRLVQARMQEMKGLILALVREDEEFRNELRALLLPSSSPSPLGAVTPANGEAPTMAPTSETDETTREKRGDEPAPPPSGEQHLRTNSTRDKEAMRESTREKQQTREGSPAQNAGDEVASEAEAGTETEGMTGTGRSQPHTGADVSGDEEATMPKRKKKTKKAKSATMKRRNSKRKEREHEKEKEKDEKRKKRSERKEKEKEKEKEREKDKKSSKAEEGARKTNRKNTKETTKETREQNEEAKKESLHETEEEDSSDDLADDLEPALEVIRRSKHRRLEEQVSYTSIIEEHYRMPTMPLARYITLSSSLPSMSDPAWATRD
jgi:hypothetical protein